VQEAQEREEARRLQEGGEEEVRAEALSPRRARIRLGRAAAAMLAIGAVTLTACGGDDNTGTSAASTTAASTPLVGTQWQLDTAALSGASPDAVTSWITFGKQGEVVGNDGCNGFHGSYTVSGSKLRIGHLASTQKACTGQADELSRRVTSALGRVAAYSISGKTLQLADAAGRKLLTYNATVPSVEGVWDVISVLYDDAIRSVVQGSTLTAEFGPDGSVSGGGGCNDFSGKYTISGTDIHIGPLASTQKACADEEVNKQEHGYFAALESARSFEQIGDELTLFDEQGRMAVTLHRHG
jgi:heat shock protein HslJ